MKRKADLIPQRKYAHDGSRGSAVVQFSPKHTVLTARNEFPSLRSSQQHTTMRWRIDGRAGFVLLALLMISGAVCVSAKEVGKQGTREQHQVRGTSSDIVVEHSMTFPDDDTPWIAASNSGGKVPYHLKLPLINPPSPQLQTVRCGYRRNMCIKYPSFIRTPSIFASKVLSLL